MSHKSPNLGMTVLENGDPADLGTVSDNFDKLDVVAGDIATVETSPTKAAHSVGEFLLCDGNLYKVTAAISAGGSLVLGTNVRTATIGSELKSLQDSVAKVSVRTQTTNPITASFTADNGTILLFTLRADSRFVVDVCIDGVWKGQREIAQWI